MARSELVTLGDLKLAGIDFARPKPLLLIAYLAIEGPQPRRHLAELFWHDAKDPMASLRVALTRLRKAAPDALHVDGSMVHSLVACDAAVLLDDLTGHHVLTETDHYPGAFLDGVDVSGVSVEMEEWVFATRELLAERVRASFLAAAEIATRRGDREGSAHIVARALSVRGAGPAEPEVLGRAYLLLRDVDVQRAAVVARELREYGIDPPDEGPHAKAGNDQGSGQAANNITVPLTAFVGRHDELRRIDELLVARRDRLITLLGTAGVGKTRLALQAAHEALVRDRFRDGVYWIGLDALADPEQVPEHIGTTLGTALAGADPPIDQLVRQLRGRHMLLVLDNYEQLIDGAMIPVRLVQECPELAIIVTTRERLRVSEERVVKVEGLPHPETASGDVATAMTYDAVRLFTMRAQRHEPSFRLDTSTLSPVNRICTLVDGAPLGLELAAAWVGSLAITDIVEGLERGLDALTNRAKDIPEKHRSLSAAFEKSWDLLDDRHQDALRRLAVFQGGFRREAAAAVAGANLTILADLVDKSLLRLSPTGRYDRHPLVHQFCREKLAQDPDDLATWQGAHGRYFRDQTCAPDDNVPRSPGGWRNLYERLAADMSEESLRRALDELPNIEAAWNHYLDVGDADSVAAVADFHGNTSEVWSRAREGQRLMVAALERFNANEPSVALARARVEGALGVTYWRLGLFNEGADLGEHALAVLTDVEPPDERTGHWWATQAVGLCNFHTGRVDRSLEALRLGHEVADEGSRTARNAFLKRRLNGLAGLSAAVMGMSAVVAGDLAQAKRLGLEAHERMHASTPRFATYAHYPLTSVALAEGDFEAAARWASEGIEHGHRVGHGAGVQDLQRSLAHALFRLERHDEAEAVLLATLRDADRIGNTVYGTPLRATLGRTLIRMGRSGEAVPILLRALRDAHAANAVPFALDDALLGLAEIAASRDDPLGGRIARFIADLESAHPLARSDARAMLMAAAADISAVEEDLEAFVAEVASAFR